MTALVCTQCGPCNSSGERAAITPAADGICLEVYGNIESRGQTSKGKSASLQYLQISERRDFESDCESLQFKDAVLTTRGAAAKEKNANAI